MRTYLLMIGGIILFFLSVDWLGPGVTGAILLILGIICLIVVPISSRKQLRKMLHKDLKEEGEKKNSKKSNP